MSEQTERGRQRKLPDWISVQRSYTVEEKKVCSSSVILSDGKFNVYLTVN